MTKVVVVGAGVVGLTSALVLAERGYSVAVVAESLPTDVPNSSYTSAWAGAHFRPFPSSQPNDPRESSYTRETYQWFKELVKSNPESSVKFVVGEEYIEDAPQRYLQWKAQEQGIEDFKIIDPNQTGRFFPKPVNFGCRYKTWVLNPPLYLAFLMRRLQMSYRVKFIKTRFNTLRNVFLSYPDVSFVVNATGQGLQLDGGYDPLSFPIRGQTLLLRPPSPDHPYKDRTITHQSSDGKWTFVIPRPFDGGVIVGGTKQVNAIHDQPNSQDTQEIVKNARVMFPELFGGPEFDADIVQTNVGFRPARKGGSRIELETVENNTKDRAIVHAYGAGGMGYEMSYGIAKAVAQIVDSKTQVSRL